MPDGPSTLADILVARAAKHPERIAYGQVTGVDLDARTMTYGELLREVRSKCASFAALGAQGGERAVLLYPSGVDFITSFLACIMAGVIPVPAYPPQRDIEPLRRICEDCAPSWVLCAPDIRDRITSKFDGVLSAPLMVLPTDTEADEKSSATAGHARTDIAMLQYTSGSTGHPKGVVITHANLLSNLAAIERSFEVDEGSVGFSWLPMYHDMGLVGKILIAVYTGSTLYFMTPAMFIQKPVLWLQAIEKFGAAFSGAPNFAYQLCVDRIGRDDLDDLDLSCWRVAFNGAEPIRSAVLEAFAEKFSACGFKRKAFLPCYGMAEASLLVSGVAPSRAPTVRYLDKRGLVAGHAFGLARTDANAVPIVSCGRVIAGHEVIIVDPMVLETLPEDLIGEIWLRGPSITSGYWSTEHRGCLPSAMSPIDRGGDMKYLRTGDLGFFRDDELYIVGRIKDLLIIRGRNHSPQDVEDVASRSHDALSPLGAVAFQAQIDGQDRVVILHEVRRSYLRSFDSQATADAIRGAISQAFQIQVDTVGFVAQQHLPRTSSGKLQRSRARDLYMQKEFSLLHLSEITHNESEAIDLHPDEWPANPLEQELRQVVSERLQVSPIIVSCSRPVIDLGLDSLSQLELTHVLANGYGVEMTAEQYFDGVSIRDIAKLIQLRTQEGAAGADQLDVLCQ
ncbi:MAG: AMP-binding protein [Rhizobiales bacterium]|nr:AMP-binding protein [Hyphomicrobiales bacterium]